MTQGFIQVVVLALIKKENKYLFTLRSDGDSKMNGYWQIPGGGLEFGEKVMDCLHREVKEELGTEINVISPLPIYDTEVRGNWQGVFITYVCELKDPNSKIVINEEASEYKWFRKEDINKSDFLYGCIEAIEAAEKLCAPSGTMFEPI